MKNLGFQQLVFSVQFFLPGIANFGGQKSFIWTKVHTLRVTKGGMGLLVGSA